MPLHRFRCSACGDVSYEEARLVVGPVDSGQVVFACGRCGGAMSRAPAGPAADPRDRVDTGLLGRPVENVADAPRLVRERVPKNTVH